MNRLISALVILMAASCGTIAPQRPTYQEAGIKIESRLKTARTHLAAGNEGQALVALREAVAVEAEWDEKWGRRRWTSAQKDDRALVYFASYVIDLVAQTKTDADREAALGAAHRHLDHHANDAATTPLLIGIARAWFALGKLERAAELLERAVARSDEGVGTALVGLAEVQEKLARPDLSMLALQSATKVAAVNTTTSVMDADNTRNIAHRRLGRILELRGEWQAALTTYEQWHPSSWCADEAIEFDYEREAGVAREG